MISVIITIMKNIYVRCAISSTKPIIVKINDTHKTKRSFSASSGSFAMASKCHKLDYILNTTPYSGIHTHTIYTFWFADTEVVCYFLLVQKLNGMRKHSEIDAVANCAYRYNFAFF